MSVPAATMSPEHPESKDLNARDVTYSTSNMTKERAVVRFCPVFDIVARARTKTFRLT